jgi:uncharacterized protein
MSFQFEWDDIKAEKNLEKHGISFNEAKTVFFDDYARTKSDPAHSIMENRYIIEGMSNNNRLIVVSFTERKDRIRIINARKSTNKERIQYEEFI